MGYLISYLLLGLIAYPFAYLYYVKKKGLSKGRAFTAGIGWSLIIVIVVYFGFKAVTFIRQSNISIPFQSSPTPTLRPTQKPQPTVSYDVDQLLILPGDLPAGYEGGQIKSRVSSNLLAGREIPIPDFWESREIAYNLHLIGWVNIVCDADVNVLQKIYDSALIGMGTYTVQEHPGWVGSWLGYKAATNNKNILFGNHNMIVTIEGIDTKISMPYAYRLDDRLMNKNICQ